MEHVSPGTLVDAVRSATAADRFAAFGAGDGAVVVDLADGTPAPDQVDAWRSLPVVIVGLGPAGWGSAGPVSGGPGSAGPGPLATKGEDLNSGWLRLVDVLVDDSGTDLDAMEATMRSTPIAATTLALLLRGTERRSVADGLVAESTAYSTLQGGPEFARWRTGRPSRHRTGDDRPRVRCQRVGSQLEITLTRPDARNALDSPMRDALCEGLLLAALDPEIERVHLRGEGPSFCAGGDLDEMGSRAEPASANLIRLHRSPAQLLSAVAARSTTHLHGACAGSGIELPAFAERVLATPDTTFALPEVALGLVPGAGGTVSLPARIGRHRTAWLALTGRTIDAATALSWGLADRISSSDASADSDGDP